MCGAKIVGADRSKLSNVQRIVSEIESNNGIAMPVVFDVLNKEQIIIAKDEIMEKWGEIDLLINSSEENSA